MFDGEFKRVVLLVSLVCFPIASPCLSVFSRQTHFSVVFSPAFLVRRLSFVEASLSLFDSLSHQSGVDTMKLAPRCDFCVTGLSEESHQAPTCSVNLCCQV